jgi:hypothetical protein
MTNQENNDNAEQANPQVDTSPLSLDRLASMIETSSLTSGLGTDATESDMQSAEDQPRLLDDPLAEELQQSVGINNRSSKNSAESSVDGDNDEESGIPSHIQKRIDKITAKRREAEAEAERLRAELEEAKARRDEPVVSRSKNAFANVLDEAGLNKALDQARKVRDWCEENPYGGEVPKGNGETIVVDESEVRKMKVNALKDIETNIPAQFQHITARRHFDPIAEKEYPWWQKRDSKEYNTAIALLKNFPELANFPDYKLVIGDFVYGMQNRQMRQVKASVNTTQRKPQLQPTRPSNAPNNASTNSSNAQEFEKRFIKSGSSNDLAFLIEARLKSR